MFLILFHVLSMIHRPPPEEDAEGQGLVEYALILVFVAVVIILLLTILGPGIQNIYQNIINAMQEASG